MMKFYITVLFSILSSGLYGDGFIAGTKVKIPTGYIPIEKLNIGDQVSCFNNKMKLSSSKIVAIKKEQVQKTVEVVFSSEVIGASLEQHFLLPTPQDPYDHFFLNDTHEVAIEINGQQEIVQVDHHKLVPLFSARNNMQSLSGLRCINKTVIVYSISLEKYHNYFVTQSDILAHNFMLTIPIFSWGAASFAWAGIGAIVGAIVTAVTNEAFVGVLSFLAKKTSPKKKFNNNYNNNNSGGSGGPRSPEKGSAVGTVLALGSKTKEIVEATVDKLKYTAETFQSSVRYAQAKNNIGHIVAQSKHNLGQLVSDFGNNTDEIAKAIVKAAEGVIPADGIFTEQIVVNNFKFTLCGRVMKGVLKVATAFKP